MILYGHLTSLDAEWTVDRDGEESRYMLRQLLATENIIVSYAGSLKLQNANGRSSPRNIEALPCSTGYQQPKLKYMCSWSAGMCWNPQLMIFDQKVELETFIGTFSTIKPCVLAHTIPMTHVCQSLPWFLKGVIWSSGLSLKVPTSLPAPESWQVVEYSWAFTKTATWSDKTWKMDSAKLVEDNMPKL